MLVVNGNLMAFNSKNQIEPTPYLFICSIPVGVKVFYREQEGSDEFHGGLIYLKNDIGIVNTEFDDILEILDSEMDELKESKREVNQFFL